MWHRQSIYKKTSGFTIAELIIVIVVIGILAAVTIVGYGSWRKSVDSAAVKSDLVAASGAMENYRNFNNGYPTSIPTTVKSSSSVTLTMYPGGTTSSYCIDGTSNNNSSITFHIDSKNSSKGAQSGTCADSQPPSTAPGSVVANAISINSINLSWNAVVGATSYKIQRSLSLSFATIFEEGTQAGNSLSSTGLSLATTYFYRVQAATTVGGGPWSTIVNFKTSAIHTAISANATITCGIASGKAYCWGYNGYGQLGNNTTTDSQVPVAVDTSLMSGTVTAVSAGYINTCAIASSQAYCWGSNGIYNDSLVPIAVDTSLMFGTVTAISAGASYHTCAIASSQAYCWGSNGSGQLGSGDTTDSQVPVAVDTSLMSGTVTAISAGPDHTCAIASGKAYCWGSNGSGQLGSGDTTDSQVPVAVDTSLMSGTVTAISAGAATCAIASDKAYCWGSTSQVPVAVNTSLMSGTVTAISAGADLTSCAIASGKAYCWGYNTFGQLGNNTTTYSQFPVAVNTSLMSGNVTAISAGYTTCAIASGQSYCWGYNGKGQFGNNTTTNSYVPVFGGPLP